MSMPAMNSGGMSFIDRLRAKMSDAPNSFLGAAAPKPKERTRELIRNVNRWDKKIWKVSRETDPVDDLVSDLSMGDEYSGGERKAFNEAPELVEGLFHMFYKANPVLEKKRRVDRELYAALRILNEVGDHPRLKDLQDYTQGDGVTTTVAIEAMGDELREILGRVPPPPPPPSPGGKKQGPGQPGQPQQGQPGQEDPNGQPGQPGQQGQPGQGQGQGQGEEEAQEDPNGQPAQPQPGSGQPDGNGDDSDPGEGDGSNNEDDELVDDEGEAEWDPDSEEAMEQAEAEWEEEYDKMLDDLDIDRIANRMVNAAQEEAEELDNLRKGIGCEDGEWHSMDPGQRAELAERLRTPQMKLLSEVIGQMKRFALGIKATRIVDVPHEAYDVEQGNVIPRILKGQFSLLGHEGTKYEFYRRYFDRELLQFKMRGTEEVGKGPIVMAIDKSGSMQGKPFMWAMAVSEALRRFAADEDRDYYAIFFGFDNDRTRFNFPEGKASFEKVLAFLGTVANGGTAFEGVLTEALEKAAKSYESEGKGKADIVFVTDGMAHLSDDWIQKFTAERERSGVRLYSVYIGGASDMRAKTGPIGLLNQFSDVVIPVKELKPASVKKIFERV